MHNARVSSARLILATLLVGWLSRSLVKFLDQYATTNGVIVSDAGPFANGKP